MHYGGRVCASFEASGALPKHHCLSHLAGLGASVRGREESKATQAIDCDDSCVELLQLSISDSWDR